jgi:hypothetical protein
LNFENLFKIKKQKRKNENKNKTENINRKRKTDKNRLRETKPAGNPLEYSRRFLKPEITRNIELLSGRPI